MDLLDLPPVTKFYLVCSGALTFGVFCDVISPLQLYFSYRLVFQQGELWRLVTTFLYWGQLNLDFFFHIFFFVRYSQMLEESTFHGRKADFIWLLVVSSATILLLFPLSPTPYLTGPLSFTLIYLWSRENPTVRLSLFGMFTISAPYLPYVLCLFSSFIVSAHLGNATSASGLRIIMSDLMGLFAGHWWYFWTVVWPRERSSGGRNWLRTPLFLIRMFDPPERLDIVREQERRRMADLRVG